MRTQLKNRIGLMMVIKIERIKEHYFRSSGSKKNGRKKKYKMF